MKRTATSIETDLASARGDRESLEQQQAQGSDRDLSPAIDAARQREQQFEEELQEVEEPSVFENYFAEEEKDTEPGAESDAPGDSVFQAYFGDEEPEPDAGQPEEGLFAEMAKEGGLMDRLTEHAVEAITDRATDRDQEPEM